MAHHSPLRILLVEDDIADRQFIDEAVNEAASLRAWPEYPGVIVICAESLEDACLIGFDGCFDAILLNLSLPDSPALQESFDKFRSVTSESPLLVLADDNDPLLAGRLLREGAQDVLVKSTLDASLLAVAIRNAIERQRFVNAARFDPVRASSPQAILPFEIPEDDGDAESLLLALVDIADVSAAAPDVEAVMLAD